MDNKLNITQRQLEIFVSIAQEGGFSRAGEGLGLSQSAMSRSIQELEAQLGTLLFHRTTRAIDLSPQGADFVVIAKRILDDLKVAVDRIAVEPSGLSGSVKFAAGSALCSGLLEQTSAAFLKSHPSVKLQLVEANSIEIVKMVQRGEVDFGIATLVADTVGTEHVKFLDAPIGILFNPNEFSISDSPTARQLQELNFVKEVDDNGMVNLLRERQIDKPELPRVILEVSSLSTQIACIRSGLAVGIMSAIAAGHPFAADLKFAVLRPASHRSLYLFRRKERFVPAQASAFIREFVHQFDAWKSAFAVKKTATSLLLAYLNEK